MQIAINISEESYKNIKEQVDKRDYPDMQIGRAIADGKPLTQGYWLTHKEYCDKNNLLPSGYGSYFWCSECGCGISGSAFYLGRYNYCPTCGADMRCDSSKDDYKNRDIGVDLNHAEAESDIEKRKEWPHKPCINYEDGCEEWAGCPCVHYKGRK